MRIRAILFSFALLAAAAAHGQGIVPWVERTKPRPDLLTRVGFDQKLNARLPLGLVFRDERGRELPLGTYFGKRPVALSLAYYECPMLCTLALNGQLRAYRALAFDIGREFEVVVVSINPHETPVLAAAKKATYLSSYRRAGAASGASRVSGTGS